MIRLQNCVQKMLRDKLAQREKELQLEVVELRQSLSQARSCTDEGGQIIAVEAQLVSLKSVLEALEREKDDLLIQSGLNEEEIHKLKTQLLEVRGQSEVKDMRIEELEEQLAE